MLKKIPLGIIFVLILSSFLFLPFRSKAQGVSERGQGLTISPPIAEFNEQLGKVSTYVISISNPTKKIVEFYPVVMNFRAKNETGEPSFYPATEEEKAFSLAHWIKFSNDKVVLPPDQTINWSYTIEVPQNAEPGGHYGVIFFATNPPNKNENVSQINIASMIGSLILVKTPGDVREEGKVTEFLAQRFYLKPPVNFTTRITNSGNVHFKPLGKIIVKNLWGKQVEEIVFNPGEGNVLPESTRKFTEEKWAPQISGFWTIPIGRFTADLNLTYGDSKKPLNSQFIFWVIPLWLIILLAIILAIIIIWVIVKLVKRKNEK
jgi:hypothetical protein